MKSLTVIRLNERSVVAVPRDVGGRYRSDTVVQNKYGWVWWISVKNGGKGLDHKKSKPDRVV